MKTKDIDISEYWDGDDAIVTIKKISFGHHNNIIDQISNAKVKGKDIEVNPQYGLLRTLTLLACMVKAPFPMTKEYIDNELEVQLGDFLFEEIDQNNALKPEKKK